MRTNAKLCADSGLALLATLLSGCPTADTFTPPILPHEIAAVVQNHASVTMQADDPFAQVEPGTVEDALSNLDGCWALYRQTMEYGDWTTGLLPFDSYEFYYFDATTGVARYQEYDVAVSGEWARYLSDEGHYTVQGAGQIKLVWDTSVQGDLSSGRVSAYALTREQKANTPLSKVTVRGDQMRIMVLFTGALPDERVFTRYTCP
jgi:hypothetical protein